MKRTITSLLIINVAIISFIMLPATSLASYRFGTFKAKPPIHVYGAVSKTPVGLSPAQIKTAYHLPATGGHGTIAIIGAYDDATIESDLGTFSKAFGLPACTTANKCFEKHLMAAGTKSDTNWAMETSLDVEWAHAIAPSAKILLVAAKTQSGQNLLDALDYATKQQDVVAVSMSWGGPEFSDETTLDSHFQVAGKTFFASSGDNGAGASWPAASPYVVAVGGTSLTISKSGTLSSEKGWVGSGGGVSAYESEPSFQSGYSIAKANGKRSIPDVAYDADPTSGFSIYRSSGKTGGWYVVGGTSAGAPQWAAIQSLGLSANDKNFYADKSSSSSADYFNDITSGSNGDCGYYCTARKHYDYVTGLGTPRTVKF